MTRPTERPMRRTRADAAEGFAPAAPGAAPDAVPAAAAQRPERPMRGATAPAAAGRPMRGAAPGPAAAAPTAAAPQAAAGGRPLRGAAPAAAPQAAPQGPSRHGMFVGRATKQPAPGVDPLEVFPYRSAATVHPFFSRMADVMVELHAVLHLENKALEEGRNDQLELLTHRKDGLAGIYLECLVNLRRDDALKQALSPEERDSLHRAGERLRAVSVDNLRRLQARIDTVSGVIDSVMEAARLRATENYRSYDQEGTAGTAFKVAPRLGVDTAL